MQCNSAVDIIGGIVKLFKEDGIVKSRDSVVKELYNQLIINKEDFERLSKMESEKTSKVVQESKETREDEIGKLCEQLGQDGKSKFLDWVQTVLLETCFAKIYLQKSDSNTLRQTTMTMFDKHTKTFETFLKKPTDMPVMSPVSYHSLRKFFFF